MNVLYDVILSESHENADIKMENSVTLNEKGVGYNPNLSLPGDTWKESTLNTLFPNRPGIKNILTESGKNEKKTDLPPLNTPSKPSNNK